MRHFSFKKAMASILSVMLIMSLMPMSFSAKTTDSVTGDGGEWEDKCAATVSVENGIAALNLHFTKGYDDFTGAWTPQLDNLIPRAISTYNTNHGATLKTTDITKITVSDEEGIETYIIGFIRYLVSSGYAAQITELDLSAATFRNRWSWQSEEDDSHKWSVNTFSNYGGSSKFPLLKTLKLGDGLTIIEYNAFNNITSLETLELNDCITDIAVNAFSGCTSLKALDLPSSLKIIAEAKYTVDGCDSLSEISYHGASADVSLYSSVLEYINTVAVTKIDLSGSNIDVDFALSVLAKSNIQYFNISDCANIEYDSVNGMLLWEKLEALKATGATVLAPANSDPYKNADTVRGDGGEWDNNATARITVNEGGVSLSLCFSSGYDDFTGAWTPQLDNLIPKAINTYNTNHGTALKITDIAKISVSNEGNATIYVMGFVRYLVSSGYAAQITELDLSAATFRNRWSWQSEEEDSRKWSVNVFSDYNGSSKFPLLKTLKLGDGLTIIEYNAFNNMTSLETLELNNCITDIGGSAFSGCTSLKSLGLPLSLNTLDDGTYIVDGCESLSAVLYHGTSDKASLYSEIMKIANRAGVTDIDLSGSGISTENALALACKNNLTAFNISNCDNIDWSSDNGKALYGRIKALIAAGTKVMFTGSSELDAFVSDDGTACIFAEGDSVKLSVYNARHIGDNETLYMANGAIENFNLNHQSRQITLADITAITVSSAEKAYLLSTFSRFLKNNLSQVQEVDMGKANVFNATYYLESDYPVEQYGNKYGNEYFGAFDSVNIKLTELKRVVLSETASDIGSYMFRNCRTLEEAVLPRALKTAGDNTFTNCVNLKTVTVTNGTFNEWTFESAPVKNFIFNGGENDVLEISGTAGNDFSNVTVYCADADVYSNGIGTNFKNKIAKAVYLGNMDEVTLKTNETSDGYFLPTSETKIFAGWKTISATEVEAVWIVYSHVLGDINNDGVVNICDYIYLKKYIAGITDKIPCDIKDIDLEGDGIDSTELTIMRRALLGIESHEEYYGRIHTVA